MKIAVVNDVAGVARLEVEALRQAGLDVDFFDLPKPGARWPRWIKPVSIPVRMALALPLILRLRRGAYDLVHVHFVSQGFVGAGSGRPYFLHAHGSDLHLNFANPVLRGWSRRWMRGARGIFYVTPNLLPYLHGFTSKATLLPNPVDTEAFKGVAPPQGLEKVLLFMRLDPVKGAATAFEAVDRMAELVRVSAMDWGPLAAEYRARFAGRVEFIEPVPHAQVPQLLERFDAVVGQLEQGVMGLSELEALAGGRLVLMRLDRKLVGEDPPPVVEVGGADDLVTQIGRLSSNPDEVRRLSAAGREWVERHHGLKAHARALIEAYGVASAPRGAEAP